MAESLWLGTLTVSTWSVRLRVTDTSILEPVQAGGIVDEDLADELGVVIDVAVEQLDFLGIVHHPF